MEKMLEVAAICKMNISQEAKDKLIAIHEEFLLLKRKYNLTTDDFKAIVIGEIINHGLSNDYDVDCEVKIDNLMTELLSAITEKGLSASFHLVNWIERYLLALPAPPLEALIYDKWIFKQFNN